MELAKAVEADVEEIGRLYAKVCDYLCEHGNYPGWKKDVYPTAEDAKEGVRERALYVARDEGRIVGTVILRHTPEDGYKNVAWRTESDYARIYVVYTLAVHPEHMGRGVGKRLMDFAEELARSEGCISLRLDVVKGNAPAESLYRKCGYDFVGTTSLGYEAYGLPWYNLYEKVLDDGEIQ